MSRHHQAHTSEVQRMVFDANNMTTEQLLTTYNIELWEDGKVYDRLEDQTYSTIAEWANSTVEGDDLVYDGYENKYDIEEDFY